MSSVPSNYFSFANVDELKQIYGPSPIEIISQCNLLVANNSSGLDLNEMIPVDPKLICKRLSNGLNYYIRKNAKPDKHAEMRLVVKAGSFDETEEERGFAHFVEHMLFQGTKNFPGKSIIEYLKSIGVAPAQDLNTYTTFDHTVYHFPLPLDSEQSSEKGLAILCDLAFHATFEKKAVESEKSPILEEKRPCKRQFSILKPTQETLFGSQHYPERMPIGKKKVIRLATAEQLRAFYLRCYRPDRMAIVAVGDFDPSMVENMIRAQFDYTPKLGRHPVC